MGNLCFLTDNLDMPNYLDSPSYYKFREFPLAFTGKQTHSNYLFWILYNNNISNIRLIDNEKCLNDGDIVFFHYDVRDKLNFNRPYKKIQILSDKPRVKGVDAYCVNSKCYIEENIDFILNEPLPLGLTKVTPSWPPNIFHCNCCKHWIPDCFNENLYKKINFNITFENNRLVSICKYDVFFFLRNLNVLSKKDEDGQNTHLPPIRKHANRLIQSWIMGVPGIFSYNPAIQELRETDYDYLEANDEYEFIECSNRLIRDKDLFYKIILNGEKRKTNFSNSIIINQIKHIADHFSVSAYK